MWAVSRESLYVKKYCKWNRHMTENQYFTSNYAWVIAHFKLIYKLVFVVSISRSWKKKIINKMVDLNAWLN